ncbi:zinc-dependent alcohol dehydrogenase [Egibacter rhizosphaerae]|uniref:zinc-dependent alcohol dehydrogenase n=1 Tax=Egibacter rhizosphaerae TaxID=1670831 RepID=UPI0013F15C95|nr:alcohol dehydrogenase catalytic domain-containing protein [Egibacter rhizosphaerae]
MTVLDSVEGVGVPAAAVLVAEGTLGFENRPQPALLRADDVLVEVEACGVCGTDLHILSDPPAHPATVGIVLGHEIVGRVHEVGAAVDRPAHGERVAIDPILACGMCALCRRGHPNLCEDLDALGVFRDGGLTRFVRVPAPNCHPIGEEVPTALAALSEPLATVMNGLEKVRAVPNEVAVVLGAGPVGLMWTALLAAASAVVVIVEPRAPRREIALEVGAAAVIDPNAAEPTGELSARTGGLGADLAIDATGAAFSEAVRMVRPAGRIVLFGMNSGARPQVPQIDITERELSVIGSFVGKGRFPSAIRALEHGTPDLAPIISGTWSLSELPAALEELRNGDAVKAIITPDDADGRISG